MTKQRIKIDSSILSFVIILSGFLYLNKNLFCINNVWDNVLDFVGFLFMLKGVLFRMSARAHKKDNSEKGQTLVTTGLYSLTRNPMYLGSFYIGVGFALMVWPWWMILFFVVLFYLRFKIQVEKEEKHLTETFGEAYKNYCKTTPRIFPDIRKCVKVNFDEIINLKEALKTKEARGLFFWPLLAMVLETFQEKIVFGTTNIALTFCIYLYALVLFFGSIFVYRKLVK